MKNLLVAFLGVLLIASTAFGSEDGASCKNEEQATQQATKEQLAQQVLCCCPIRNGGQCCNYQPVCLGLVDGCICARHSIQSEPQDSNGKTGKVRI